MTNGGEWPENGLEAVGACPVCAATARSVLHRDLRDRAWSAPGAWTLYRCEDCGSGYLDPRPARETIGLAYGGYYTHTAAPADEAGSRLANMRRALRNGYLNSRYGHSFAPASALGPLAMAFFPLRRERADRWVQQLHRPSGRPRLLDVGCGNGAFLVRMQEAGWDVQGLDLDATAVAVARDLGVPARCGALGDTTFPKNQFDAVTLSHVVEHLPDPADSLRICHRILRPGGVLSLTTPNLASVGHSLFGRDWIGLEAPRHLVLFTPDSLARCLDRIGFEITRHAPSCTARWFFGESLALFRGTDPVPARLRWKAHLADLRALRQPESAEEIVLVARKRRADAA